MKASEESQEAYAPPSLESMELSDDDGEDNYHGELDDLLGTGTPNWR